MAHLVKDDRNQDKEKTKDGGQTFFQWYSPKILDMQNTEKKTIPLTTLSGQRTLVNPIFPDKILQVTIENSFKIRIIVLR